MTSPFHLHFLQLSEVVETMEIHPAPLSDAEGKDILNKQKTKDQKLALKRRISKRDKKSGTLN